MKKGAMHHEPQITQVRLITCRLPEEQSAGGGPRGGPQQEPWSLLRGANPSMSPTPPRSAAMDPTILVAAKWFVGPCALPRPAVQPRLVAPLPRRCPAYFSGIHVCQPSRTKTTPREHPPQIRSPTRRIPPTNPPPSCPESATNPFSNPSPNPSLMSVCLAALLVAFPGRVAPGSSVLSPVACSPLSTPFPFPVIPPLLWLVVKPNFTL